MRKTQTIELKRLVQPNTRARSKSFLSFHTSSFEQRDSSKRVARSANRGKTDSRGQRRKKLLMRKNVSVRVKVQAHLMFEDFFANF